MVDVEVCVVLIKLNDMNWLEILVYGDVENGCVVLVVVLDNFGKGVFGVVV